MPYARRDLRPAGSAGLALLIPILMAAPAAPLAAQPSPGRIGIVVMHGKGGAPGQHVAALAAGLEEQGYLVANLEMPWSGRRSYDTPVPAAESEVVAALEQLRTHGAQHLFVAGHSQGGLFALYFGGRHPVDGVIAIAPGGNVAAQAFRQKLGGSVARARELIAAGKGDERTEFLDFEGSRGTYRVSCTAASYLSWFDPDGAMNELAAVRSMDPQVPVLFIVPRGDYPPLQAAKQAMFAALPPHPLTRLYEPDSSHLGAPAASLGEIARWTAQVAASRNTAAAPSQAARSPSR